MTWLNELAEESKAKRNSVYAKGEVGNESIRNISNLSSRLSLYANREGNEKTLSAINTNRSASLYTKGNFQSNQSTSNLVMQKPVCTTGNLTEHSLVTSNSITGQCSYTRSSESNLSQGATLSVATKMNNKVDLHNMIDHCNTTVREIAKHPADIANTNTMYMNTSTANAKLGLVSNEFNIKSILKKHSLQSVDEEPKSRPTTAILKTQHCLESKREDSIKKNISNSGGFIGTPIRLSAYARRQVQCGLPLPKENRYEALNDIKENTGKILLENSSPPHLSKLATYVSPPPNIPPVEGSTKKRVRWADSQTKSPKKLVSFHWHYQLYFFIYYLKDAKFLSGQKCCF